MELCGDRGLHFEKVFFTPGNPVIALKRLMA
jgi:hypothetical protein